MAISRHILSLKLKISNCQHFKNIQKNVLFLCTLVKGYILNMCTKFELNILPTSKYIKIVCIKSKWRINGKRTFDLSLRMEQFYTAVPESSGIPCIHKR